MEIWRRYNIISKGEDGAWLDGVAVGASFLCLAHCLLLPLVFAALPAAAAIIGLPDWFHAAAFLVAVPASALAMLGGYRRHGAILPVLIGALGLALLGAGALLGFRLAVETALTVAGSMLLAAGHLFNWRLRRSARSDFDKLALGDG
ncbi:MAG TPA: MerC domain-containing protein [Allosphingosinicella sp.]|nr:MerC domain-containing protein [Allosphingosinicella sp.]